MRLRIGAVLLALAPFSVTAGQPAAAATTVTRPAYLNIVVDSPSQPGRPPTFTVQRVPSTFDNVDVSPQVDCSSVFQPAAMFMVTCTPVDDGRIELGNDVVVSGFRCENAAVRAEISGPAANEYVTGTIRCGEPPNVGGSCTATANMLMLPSLTWQGQCFQQVPNGPLPIRCSVNLTGVVQDSWRVTCYGTDP